MSNSMEMATYQAVRSKSSIYISRRFPVLFAIIILFALTSFVCTHKIPAEEECLSSNVLCYECDSQSDPNCNDPFDFSPEATLEPITVTTNSSLQTTKPDYNTRQQQQQQQQQGSLIDPYTNTNTDTELYESRIAVTRPNDTMNSSIISHRRQKKLPTVAVCHGCCVKITSKMPDGGVYVKRTCTTNLQINYFMVGLVCMKESGDRGKMCFCETDYCNGQLSIFHHMPQSKSVILIIISILSFVQYQIFLSSGNSFS